MNTKLKTEIEKLKKEERQFELIREEQGDIYLDDNIDNFKLKTYVALKVREAKLFQTKKCIEIFKEIINSVFNDIENYQSDEVLVCLKDELKSQLEDKNGI